jgi:hypothetical protein
MPGMYTEHSQIILIYIIKTTNKKGRKHIKKYEYTYDRQKLWPLYVTPVRVDALRQIIPKYSLKFKIWPLVPIRGSKPRWTDGRTDWLSVIIWLWLWSPSFRPEDDGSTGLWNDGILPQHYTASQPRRPNVVMGKLWKTTILHYPKFTAQLINTTSAEH